MSRRSAPKRDVVTVERVGAWGRTAYLHTLACGHVQERKRTAPASRLACEECETSYSVADEVSLERLRLQIAAGLRVPESSVSLDVDGSHGRLRFRGVWVYLDPAEARRLAR